MSLKHETQNGADHYVALFGKMDRHTYLYIQTDTMLMAIYIVALWAIQGSDVKS